MDRKLGYQRLSKLLFRIDHLDISNDFDTRKNFIEFYIMVYSRISTIFKIGIQNQIVWKWIERVFGFW